MQEYICNKYVPGKGRHMGNNHKYISWSHFPRMTLLGAFFLLPSCHPWQGPGEGWMGRKVRKLPEGRWSKEGVCPLSFYGEGACEVATPLSPSHLHPSCTPDIYPSIRAESLGSLSRLTQCKGLLGLLISRSQILASYTHAVCPRKIHSNRLFFIKILNANRNGWLRIVQLHFHSRCELENP